MSLTVALNTALSGLRVNRESLAVLSQNIANANNKDYSRKIIDQSSVTLAGVGNGVTISEVARKIDTYLQGAIRSQSSTVGRADTLSDFADRVQTLLGKPGTGSSIDSYVTSFFNSLQALAETPERSTFRINVVNAATNLTTQISQLYDSIQALRYDADQEIGESVTDINDTLRELYNLNTAISNSHIMNRPNSELLDKRDAAIKDLAAQLDVNIFTRADDTIRIYTAGGATLLDESLYELDYMQASSPESFNSDGVLSALNVYRLTPEGTRMGNPQELISRAVSSEVTSAITTGKLSALLAMRDEKLPEVLEQLDMLAARMRDSLNALHNKGSGYPGSTSLTGTRLVAGGDALNWTGKVRIGLVDAQGQPLLSPYSGEESGQRPLTIDLSQLDAGTGDGKGYPSTQAIINEINQHFTTPQNKVSLGNLNNIQLASGNQRLPLSTFNFDFDLENISADASDFFVTAVTVLDDVGATMTTSNTLPSFALANTGTYTTTVGSQAVTVTAAAPHGLQEGDVIYMPDPGGAVDGIPASAMTGYFTVTNITSTTFQITVNQPAGGGGSTDVAGLSALTSYINAPAGEKTRTGSEGSITADVNSNLTSLYYDISVSVGVVEEDGSISTAIVQYRIPNNEYNLYNRRYGARAVSGDATMTVPFNTTQPYARAKLVDEDGNELPKVNGQYYSDQQGYLKIETTESSYYLVMDSLDSSENGLPIASPYPVAGTGRGFSHYFELNNFFDSNEPTPTGDTVLGSAKALSVASQLRADPNQLSTGTISQSRAPTDITKPPLYTYERILGDNSIAQQMAELSTGLLTFDATGGLPASRQTLNGYASEILGFAAADSSASASNQKNAQIILDGFIERSSAISGVNLDEELANTIIYQNAFSASARIITITDELFKDLISAFGR